MCMDLADPVSSGKYSGTFVFAAPVAEPTVMFTVPLNGCTIVATATVVTLCSSSLRPHCAAGVFALRCRVVVEVSPDDAYYSAWDSVMPTKGNTLSITSSTKKLLGVL